ncbi:MAG TPA: cation:dicarboxylase symporter family transporter [Acidobacteriaceae bacterium]|nr:cation:dicarboxylase symporter family transporter [Acidobacteriaceae bacterium]
MLLPVIAGLTLYAAAGTAQALAPATRPFAEAVRILALLLLAWAAGRRRSLTGWIFVSMLAGIELGVDAPHVALASRFLSDIFLRLIRVIVAPLILGTLITGIAGHAEAKTVGRLGLKSLVYFEVLTTIALIIGLAAIDISKAGVGLNMSAAAVTAQHAAGATQPPPLSWQQFLIHVFPENIASAVAENQILQVVVFAILFGLALGRLSEAKRAPMLRLAESLTETMFAFTNFVMLMAPLGVGAALAFTVAQSGLGVMFNLGKLLLTLYVALVIFTLVGMLPAALLARIPIRKFIRAVAEPATIAFATSTSEAALPRAMEDMEAFGVPRKIVAFVIPTGYSFNLAGSALYLALASIFTAQAAGIHMSLGKQLAMLATLMLTSKGVAGVPRAVLVVLLATSSVFGLPTEPILVILGVDALMDMGRTTINVVGNCLASAVVAQWEGEFQTETPSPEAVAALES